MQSCLRCPNGHGPMAQGRTFWVCMECGSLVPAEEPANVLESVGFDPMGAADILARLPAVVATPYEGFLRARGAFLKLHHLAGTAELLTRLCATILVADCFQETGGRFSDSLVKTFCAGLRRPTFGAWAAVTRAVLAERKGAPQCIPALPAFVEQRLLPELGSSADSPDSGIIGLRNHLAHCCQLPIDEGESLLARHVPRFEQLVSDVATVFSEVQIVGVPEPGRFHLLQGTLRSNQPVPCVDLSGIATEQILPGDVVLVGNGKMLSLFPLHAYGDVFHHRVPEHVDERECEPFERIGEASPSPLLYWRCEERKFLEYTCLSPATSHGQDGRRALEKFRQMFRVAEWRSAEAASQRIKAFDFGPWILEWQEVFVGRSAEVQKLNTWVREKGSGVGWVEGTAGAGKSALLADFVTRYFNGHELCKIVHFFRTGDSRCSRASFLENAISKLGAYLGRVEVCPADLMERSVRFTSLLAEASAGDSAARGPRVLFVLDGLDELSGSDPGFVELVAQNQAAGVIWLCAGRSEGWLKSAFRTLGADFLFGEEGLQGLNEEGIRELLDRECGRAIYDLLAQDRPEAMAADGGNRFLRELLVRSEGGLPQYLRLFAEDIREGRFSFAEGQERKLPRGLSAYYERILFRLQVSDVAAVLTPVFAVLAWAKEPLSCATLLAVLSKDRLLRAADGEELLAKALDFGHMMLRRVPDDRSSDANAWAYSISHESFRQHLLASETVRRSVRAARQDLARLARRWKMLKSPVVDYVLMHGPDHLLEDGRPSEAASLLCTRRFAEGMVAKADAHHFGLVCDRVSRATGLEATAANLVARLGKAALAERQFLAQHPSEFFSVLFNTVRWQDAGAAEPPRTTTAEGLVSASSGEVADGPLSRLMETWLNHGPSSDAGTVWVRSLRPPAANDEASMVLRGHTKWVEGVCFSPDGSLAVSADAGSELRVWDAASGRLLNQLCTRHDGYAGVAFSSMGRILVAVQAGLLLTLDTLTLQAVGQTGTSGRVECLACDPRGRLAAVGMRNGRVALWRGMAEPPAMLQAHQSSAFAVAVHADTGRVASGSSAGTVRFWDASCGRLLWEQSENDDPVIALSIAPDGKTLARAKVNSDVTMLDAADGRVLWRRPTRGPGHFRSLAFSPDGQTLAAGLSTGSLELRHAATGALIKRVPCHSGSVHAVAFSPDGLRVISGAEDGLVRITEVKGEAQPAPLSEQGGRIRSMAFSPDGTTLASVSACCPVEVCLWSVANGTCLRRYRLDNVEVEQIRFDAAGQRVLTLEDQTALGILDLRSGERQKIHTEYWRIRKVVVAPAGPTVLLHSGSDEIELWSLEGPERLASFPDASGLDAAVYSPDGMLVAVAHPSEITIASASGGVEPAHIPTGSIHPTRLAFCGGHSLLAVGCQSGDVFVASLTEGTLVHIDQVLPGPVDCLAVSSDGVYLIAGSGCGTSAVVVDLQRLAPIALMEMPPESEEARKRAETERRMRQLQALREEGPAAAIALAKEMGMGPFARPSEGPWRLGFVAFGRSNASASFRCVPGGSIMVSLPEGKRIESWETLPDAIHLADLPQESPWCVDSCAFDTGIWDRRLRKHVAFVPGRLERLTISHHDPAVFAGCVDSRVCLFRIEEQTPGQDIHQRSSEAPGPK